MRIDGHQHFWTLQRDDYTWLTPDLKALYRDFLPDDLQPLLIQANVDHTVLVQAAATTDETRYLLEIAKRQPIVAGVVGWVDMNSPEGAINTLDEFTCHSKFVGIRPMIQEINDPAWINQPKLGAVLNALIERDLCFDALVRSAHLPYLLKCLTRHPTCVLLLTMALSPTLRMVNGSPGPTVSLRLRVRPQLIARFRG